MFVSVQSGFSIVPSSMVVGTTMSGMSDNAQQQKARGVIGLLDGGVTEAMSETKPPAGSLVTPKII
jgi:hypothetical protein